MRLLQLLVVLQLTLLVERLVASVAFVRIGRNVDRLLVGANGTFVVEPLVAVRALVGLFPCVQSHMNGQSFLVVQHFVAAVAFEGLSDLFVSPRVGNQIRLVVEAFHTNFTLVRFFPGV